MPDATELEKYYKTLKDEELVNLKREGGFTAEAEQVLGEELARRNLRPGDLKRYSADCELTFDEFADFVREFWNLSSGKEITPETQFERDLDLTGDDGDELLLATERRFNIKLGSEETGIRETFNLGPNEYLFNSEGWGPSRSEIISLFSGGPTVIRKFTVGELFDAVRRIKGRG